ncbi:MAG: PRC-barrel domain-containing protein [Nitrospinota bacterium]
MNWALAFKKNLPLPFEWKLAGYDIIDSEDKFVSRVVELLCEEETKIVRYLIGDIGGLMGISGKKVLVPANLVTRAGSGQVIASTTLEMILDSPPVYDPENPTSEEESAIFSHYEARPYWDRVNVETSMEKAGKAENNSESIEIEGMEKDEEDN